jgi:hypothetical protein
VWRPQMHEERSGETHSNVFYMLDAPDKVHEDAELTVQACRRRWRIRASASEQLEEKLKVYRREVDHENESEKGKGCCVGASNERWRIGESATKDDFTSIP